MSRLRAVGAALLLLFVGLVLSGCDDESLTGPEIQNDLFRSYVALGNSITAGLQSGGIDNETQSESYAVLLADQMNTPFGVPELNPPGCPPPFERFFNEAGVPDPQRPNGTDDETCGLRNPEIPLHVNNVAVPNAKMIDVLDNADPSSSPNALTQFILGGQTQIEAALDANPTFVTVWIGNNDVLGPARMGTDDVTPVDEFRPQYVELLNRLESGGTVEGGVLIGMANVIFTPFFSPGPVYAGLDQAGQFPSNFDVASSCNTEDPNTGLTPLVPLDYGFTLIGQAMQTNETVTLDCQASQSPVLTLNEVSTLAQTVQQYNAFIQEQADQRGYAYFDPNNILAALYTNDDEDADPTNDLIPKFPNRGSDQPFGSFFSLDGIHPSAATHRAVTNQLVQVINETYDTNLSSPANVPDLPTPGN